MPTILGSLLLQWSLLMSLIEISNWVSKQRQKVAAMEMTESVDKPEVALVHLWSKLTHLLWGGWGGIIGLVPILYKSLKIIGIYLLSNIRSGV